jgi:hypothetical protein
MKVIYDFIVKVKSISSLDITVDFLQKHWTSCKKSVKKICSRWGLNPCIKNESVNS